VAAAVIARTLAAGLLIVACGCSSSPAASTDGGIPDDASRRGDDGAWAAGDDDYGDGGHPLPIDGGSAVGDAGTVLRADRFVTRVVSFSPTDCTGFGVPSMPAIVEGPPVGGGTSHGSTDVVSLGSGGSIVVSFEPNAIVDGPGPDFIVFENPFVIGGGSPSNPSDVYAEPGQVSVSDDGTTWHAFPCAPRADPQSPIGTGTAPPYGTCAGWHVVYSAPGNGISPVDTTAAGGDGFDLADIGVTHARYVRIVDQTSESCPASGAPRPTTNGFDLDAVAIVNAEQP
jgi:hypothetical protein